MSKKKKKNATRKTTSVTKNKITKNIKKKEHKKVSDEEFLAVFNNITKRLVYKFKFGYHDIDDMKQQAAVFAVEGLEKYDHKRPLENFLWTHIRNRLFNFKRDNYQRPDKPCLKCPLYQPNNPAGDCKEHRDKTNCDMYKSWFTRNNNKKNIMQPTYIDGNEPPASNDLLQHLDNKELVEQIEDLLPVKYRDLFLKLVHGSKICKSEKFKVQNYIKKHILNKINKD